MTNLSPLMTATSSALGWLLWSLLVGGDWGFAAGKAGSPMLAMPYQKE